MSTWRRWWAVLALAASSVAGASDVTPGFGASLRLGYGAAMGRTTGASGELADTFSGQVPLQLDVGYRVAPQLTVAVYGQYAATSVANGLGCDQPGVVCSGRSLRGGVEVFWGVLPGHALEPWLGCGSGYEWTSLSVEARGTRSELQLRGLEYWNVQLGADYALSPTFSVGPFAQLTFAEYSTVRAATNGAWSSGDVDTRLHEWLQLGVRGSLNL